MDPLDFLVKQDEVYRKFNDENKLIKEGIVPNIKPQQSGYLVVFKHPDSIAEKV